MQGKRGGGVAVVHKANTTITKQPTESYRSSEHMEVLVRTRNDYVCCVLYRPTNRSVVDFVEDLMNNMNYHTTTSGRLIVVGDLNIHLNNGDDHKVSRFIDFLNFLNLHQLTTTGKRWIQSSHALEKAN